MINHRSKSQSQRSAEGSQSLAARGGERTTSANSAGLITQLQQLNQMLGNRAVSQMLGSTTKVVQRAIDVNGKPLPRNEDLSSELTKALNKHDVLAAFNEMNGDRSKVYSFASEEHMLKYLLMKSGKFDGPVTEPQVQAVTPDQLERAHGRVQDIRFTNIFQPSSNQIPQSAPGAHQIPVPMMPTPGEGHYWVQSQQPSTSNTSTGISTQPQYTLFQDRQKPPSSSSEALTYGNPQNPSLIMNQNQMNIGMYINPTFDDKYYTESDRKDTKYGGIGRVTGSGRVRGHPYRLEQTQINTDDPKKNFDNDRRAYTDESDSTKTNGGISTWRSNEIENVSIQNNRPFTQINVNPQPGVLSGIGRPDQMYYRRLDSSGTGYDDMLMDNTGTTGYRQEAFRPGIQAQQKNQTEHGREQALLHPYPEPPVHVSGSDYSVPPGSGYTNLSMVPPTPFMSSPVRGGSATFDVDLPATVLPMQRIELQDGRKVMVKTINSKANGVASCSVIEVPGVYAPSFPDQLDLSSGSSLLTTTSSSAHTSNDSSEEMEWNEDDDTMTMAKKLGIDQYGSMQQ
ncbi:MAG: hypothetical protein ACE3L7_19695 [Candidatus Pristimantibacillus sp.]